MKSSVADVTNDRENAKISTQEREYLFQGGSIEAPMVLNWLITAIMVPDAPPLRGSRPIKKAE
jgi:hypothetical protein